MECQHKQSISLIYYSLYYFYYLIIIIIPISNVKLPDNHSPDTTLACFSYIPGLRHLSIVHCGLETIQPLKGILIIL